MTKQKNHQGTYSTSIKEKVRHGKNYLLAYDLFTLQLSVDTYLTTELVFVDLLVAQESIPSMAGRYDNPICRTGPPCYIGWRNRFLGIDSWVP
jgi:hypothetical protein